jgi:hypothetical protein
MIGLLFIPIFGDEFYTISQLNPKVVFPMHHGGDEKQYSEFEKKVKAKSIPVQVGAANKSGMCFFYSNNQIKKLR